MCRTLSFAFLLFGACALFSGCDGAYEPAPAPALVPSSWHAAVDLAFEHEQSYGSSPRDTTLTSTVDVAQTYELVLDAESSGRRYTGTLRFTELGSISDYPLYETDSGYWVRAHIPVDHEAAYPVRAQWQSGPSLRLYVGDSLFAPSPPFEEAVFELRGDSVLSANLRIGPLGFTERGPRSNFDVTLKRD